MSDLDELIQEIEINKLKKLYNENIGLFTEVSNFILKKRLMLYGGLPINLLLPKKHRFYKDYTLNDFDCYSKNAENDAIELGNLLKRKGYKYIKVRKAKHKNTYRVYVRNIQIVDLSQIDDKIFDSLYEMSRKELKSLKAYKDKYLLLPINMIKRNLYYELARPEQSGFRWGKVYTRLNLFLKFYKNKPSKMQYKCVPINNDYKKIVQQLLKYVKTNALPIVDAYAMKFYMKMNTCCCRLNENSKFLVVLSDNYHKTKDEIISMVEKSLDKQSYQVILDIKDSYTDILNARYGINILNKRSNEIFRLVSIVDTSTDCYSVQKIQGYTVGTVDTILYFLYSYSILNHLYGINDSFNHEILYLINEYEKYIAKHLSNNIKKRLHAMCYGIVNREDDIKINWKQRMTIKYI